MLPPDELGARVNNWMLLLFAGVSLLVYQFLAASILLAWEEPWSLALGIVAGVVLGILLPFRSLARKLELGFRRQFLFAGFNLWTGFLVVAATLSLIPALEVLTEPVARYFPPSSEYFRFVGMMRPDSLWEGLLVFTAVAIAVPIGEELLFRGLIQRLLFRHARPALAILLAGLLFGAIHPLFSAPAVAVLGFWFGLVMLWGGNLWYPILAHGVWNLANLSILLSNPVDDMQQAMPSPFENAPILWLTLSLLLFGFFAGIIRLRLEEASTPAA